MKDYKLASTTQHITFDLVLSIDHLTPATGKSPTVLISKNAAAYGAPIGAVTEIGNGTYKLAADATDRNTLGDFNLYVTATGCDPYREKYSIVAYDPFTVGMGIWDMILENGQTVAWYLRVIIAGLAGKVSGVMIDAPKFRDQADSKNRISATTTADGRTSVTLDGS